ncbi:alpha-ketoglutarate-dependent dioxygenase AlkB family protein [Psychrobacter sp. LV10R520-6]|uniref:alpha-ketoglutarate-dependent dioxygenase AlkB family protein n=1 Tax=Psychrobacter sp. LV10R520-6 TaxID=1415574 RepID=UPI0024CAD0FB|nr:alpha-ketoglutarate-dependent dioxygenase AlkB [Psychrobacter sp. LV10R520-6]SNT71192.1 DNA-N1-methyladenine dioxygenase [Psychrobacter sp. LV10R520-6]
MADLFAPHPTENLLPYDGRIYDLGQIDCQQIVDNYNCNPDCDYSDDHLYQRLLTTLLWQSDIVTLFGKTHITKRQIVWMGDEGLSYRYAGHTRQATGWHPIVFHVKQIIEDKIRALNLDLVDATDIVSTNGQDHIAQDHRPYFNACLLNYYPSGDEGMGYHADDEKELGPQPLIAALSLGATRKMLFKHKPVKDEERQDKVELYLTSGQVILMTGVTQQHWKHSITKTKKVNEGRISLTFRHMVTA